MKKLLALAIALAPSLALAQNTSWPPPAGAIAFLGVYNSVAPTMTSGSAGFAQLDANGNLNVNVKAGSGSGCPGTVGTPCVVSQATAANLNMTEVNSASILSAVQGAIPAGTNKIGTIDPATIASWGLMSGTSPGTAPTNTLIAGGKYNATIPTLTDGQTAPLQLNASGSVRVRQDNPYPDTAVPETISATGTTAATTATLAAAANVTTYICGFSIRANATAAATGNATVTGTITGTLNFTQWTAPNASGLGVTEMIFSPCVPASATNTTIAVVSAAPGTGGVVSVTAWGYKL